jgi:hypothetical protein
MRAASAIRRVGHGKVDRILFRGPPRVPEKHLKRVRHQKSKCGKDTDQTITLADYISGPSILEMKGKRGPGIQRQQLAMMSMESKRATASEMCGFN